MASRLVEPVYQSIGRRIQDARTRKGFNQGQLASMVGLPRTSIVAIEQGKQRTAVHVLISIAEALGVQVASLVPADETFQVASATLANRSEQVQNFVRKFDDLIKLHDS